LLGEIPGGGTYADLVFAGDLEALAELEVLREEASNR